MIGIIVLLLPAISLLSKKVRLFLYHRKKYRNQIYGFHRSRKEKLIWLHCASLGEFELSKPLIKFLKTNHPKLVLILTFFSPSGLKSSTEIEHIDLVGYLPLDTRKRVGQFLEITKPDMAILVKYEFWPNLLFELHRRDIITYAISCRFYRNQFLFYWYGKWLLKLIKSIDHLFVQDEKSKTLLERYQFDNVSVCGDLRIDRVIENASKSFSNEVILSFLGSSNCIVAGSTWDNDHEILLPIIGKKFSKIIIAPHDISPDSISSLEQKIHLPYEKFTCPNPTNIHKAKILILDTIGILSMVYRYAQITYVGGGFSKKGLHNILEPSSYFKPVLFGPHYKHFPEATDLIEKGIGYSVRNTDDLNNVIDCLLETPEKLFSIRADIGEYLTKNEGGTKKVYQYMRNEINIG